MKGNNGKNLLNRSLKKLLKIEMIVLILIMMMMLNATAGITEDSVIVFDTIVDDEIISNITAYDESETAIIEQTYENISENISDSINDSISENINDSISEGVSDSSVEDIETDTSRNAVENTSENASVISIENADENIIENITEEAQAAGTEEEAAQGQAAIGKDVEWTMKVSPEEIKIDGEKAKIRIRKEANNISIMKPGLFSKKDMDSSEIKVSVNDTLIELEEYEIIKEKENIEKKIEAIERKKGLAIKNIKKTGADEEKYYELNDEHNKLKARLQEVEREVDIINDNIKSEKAISEKIQLMINDVKLKNQTDTYVIANKLQDELLKQRVLKGRASEKRARAFIEQMNESSKAKGKGNLITGMAVGITPEVKVDKETYNIGDTVKISIIPEKVNHSLYLFTENSTEYLGMNEEAKKEIIAENAGENTISALISDGEELYKVSVKYIVTDKNIDENIEDIEIVDENSGSTEMLEATIDSENVEVVLDKSNVEGAQELEVKYTTPGPEAFERAISENSKEIIVSSDVHYEEILAYTELDREANEEDVHMFWMNNGSKEEIEIKKTDKNENGLVDYVEWVVPHLSEQTYILEINITDAQHLNSTRGFISNIFNQTKEQDDAWSEPIYHGEYARAIFQQNMTNGNIINLYVRNNQSINTTIEIFEKDGTTIIGSTPIITTTKLYDVTLSGMTGYNDTFDIKVVNQQNNSNAYLEFDYIHDAGFTAPTLTTYYLHNESDSQFTSYRQMKTASTDTASVTSNALALPNSQPTIVCFPEKWTTSNFSTMTKVNGTWNFSIYYSMVASGGVMKLFANIFKINTTGAEINFVNSSNSERIDTYTAATAVNWLYVMPSSTYTNLSVGERIGVRFCVNITSKKQTSAYLYWENTTPSNVQIPISLNDTIPPNINFTSPTETTGTTISRSNIYVNVTATDIIGSLKNITINLYNSSRALINSTTTNSSPNYKNFVGLSQGTYYFNATAYDTVGNVNHTETRNVTIISDTTTPAWSNNRTSPTTPTTYNATKQYQFNVTWTDAGSGVHTALIEHNFTGTSANYTVTTKNGDEYYYNYTSLGAGSYVWKEYANDSSGNKNNTDQWTYVVNKATPTIGHYLNGTNANLTVTYPQPVNASGTTDIGTLIIYRNGTAITNGANYTLAAGYYIFEYNVTGNANYTNDSKALYATVNKATSNVTLNFTQDPPIEYGTLTNVTCTDTNPEAAAKLYRNGIDVTNEIGTNVTLDSGIYNYTCNVTSTQNYTSATTSAIYTVLQVMAGGYYLHNESDSQYTNYKVMNISSTENGILAEAAVSLTNIGVRCWEPNWTSSPNFTSAVSVNGTWHFSVWGYCNSVKEEYIQAKIYKLNSSGRYDIATTQYTTTAFCARSVTGITDWAYDVPQGPYTNISVGERIGLEFCLNVTVASNGKFGYLQWEGSSASYINIPLSEYGVNATTTTNQTAELGNYTTIQWNLSGNGGYYNVYRNGTLVEGPAAWSNNVPVIFVPNTYFLGDWNYTITYNETGVGDRTPMTTLIRVVDNVHPSCSDAAGEGSSIGQITQASINVDGSMNDWAGVLANPLNYVTDLTVLQGDSDTGIASDRDMTGFAYTYTSQYLNFYFKRFVSGSSQVSMLAYMDYGNDGYMNSTDKVIVFTWAPSKRQYDSKLYNYNPASPSGDIMNGDGYKMPGSITVNKLIEIGVTGGTADGTQLETRVLWSDLGFAGPTAIRYKASSANGGGANLPTQIQDNIGAVATSQSSYIIFFPDRAKSAVNGSIVYYDHDIMNCGNTGATIEIANASSQGWTMTLYYPNGTAIADTNANGKVDISLAASVYNIIIAKITVPGTATIGTVDVATINASGPTNNKTVTDTTTIANIAITPKTYTKYGTLGMNIELDYTIYNYQSTNDTINVNASSSEGWNVNLSYANGTALTDTNGDGKLDIGNVLSQDSKQIKAIVSIPSGATAGTTDTVNIWINSSSIPSRNDLATANITANTRLILTQDHNNTVGTGITYYYLLNITNNWNQTEPIEISKTSNMGWSTTFYSSDKVTALTDTNSNGIADINVSGFGGSKIIYAAIDVPTNATIGQSEITNVYANSSLNSSIYSMITINQTVRGIAVYNDSGFTNLQDVFDISPATNTSVYAKADYLGGFTTVFFGWYSGNGSLFKQSANKTVSANSANDFISIDINSSLGAWTVILYNSSNNQEISRTTFTTRDMANPRVYGPVPAPNSTFALNSTIEIAVNVSDFGPIYTVTANITFPNGSSQLLVLSNPEGDKYNNYFTIPNLSGRYNVSFFANDTFGYYNDSVTTYFNTTATDTVSPTINMTYPGNNSLLSTSSVTFQCSATDDLALSKIQFYRNGLLVQENEVSGTSTSTSYIAVLPDGNYNWSCRSYDASGNYNQSMTYNFSIDATGPAWTNNKTYPVSPATYSPGQTYQFNVTWTDAIATVSTVIIEHNFTGTLANYTVSTKNGNEYHYNYTDLAAGTYVWREYANDTLGNWNRTTQWTYVVNKANGTVYLYLNGSRSNIGISTGTSIDINATLINGTGIIYLYNEGVLINSGASPLYNLTTFNEAKVYNITATYPGDNNYTSAYETWFVNAQDNTAPAISITYPQNTTYYSTVSRLNYTYYDTYPGYCWYSTNNGATNSSAVSAGINFTGVVSAEGPNTWTLYCNDSFGNMNKTNVTFEVRLPPAIVFNYQYPADLNLTNFLGPGGVNISYNISSFFGIDNTSVKLYYKSNSTLDNIMFYLNGTAYSGYFTDVPIQNGTPTYIWNLNDNQVLPGTYNYGEVTMERTPHSSATLSNQNDYISIQFYNVSSQKQYTFFEIMANRTAGTGSLTYFYCNSSYAFSNSPASNANCVNFYTQTTNTYNHVHSNYSMHMLAPMTINTTTGSIGTVKVTSTSYLMIRGTGSTTWSYYYISNTSRADAYKTTANGGNSWTSQTYTVDSHIHQFGANTSLWYYACANNTVNLSNCSAVRQDLFELAGLPPTSPYVYSPIQANYRGNISINYTAAVSPNSYAISYYNITLLDANETFVKTILANNSNNLSYLWDSTTTNDGEYIVKVQACDIFNQCSYGLSANFTIDNTKPYIKIESPMNTTYNNATILINITATDTHLDKTWYNWNGTNATYDTSSYVTFNQGTNILYAWANDTASNINSTNVTFYVDSIRPTVRLMSPENNSYDSNGEIVFKYNVSDLSTVENCSLILNGTARSTNNSIVKDIMLMFNEYGIMEGTYEWSVNCTDALGNIGESSRWTITVDYPENATNDTLIINETIQNANGTFIGATIELIDLLSGELDTNTTSGSIDNISSGQYDIKITPTSTNIKQVLIHNYSIIGNITDIIDIDNYTSADYDYVNTFALKPYITGFEYVNVTVQAMTGDALVCYEWNFTSRTCEGRWLKLGDYNPGQNYTLQLYVNASVGFVESNMSINLIDIGNFMIDNNQTRVRQDGNVIDMVLVPDADANTSVVNITIRSHNSLNKSNDLQIGEVSNMTGWQGNFLVNPEILNFINLTIYMNATERGTSLWKCRNYSYEDETCLEDIIFVRNITPGEVFEFTVSPEDPVFFQQPNDSIGIDSYVDEQNPNTNYGTNTEMRIDNRNAKTDRGMILWNISDIPPELTIVDAVMEIYVHTESGGAVSVDIARINQSWNETGVTWNNRPGFDATYNTTSIDAVGWYSFNITALTQNWHNGSLENYGVYIKASTEQAGTSNNLKRFWSSDYTVDITLRPKLNITAIDTVNPNVTLNAPAAGYVNSTASPVNITFNCSVTDNYNLSNISLYITNASNSSFALNRTTNVSGKVNSSTWTVELSNGNYTWNCVAYDAQGNLDWGDSNRTITINYTNTAPMIIAVNYTPTVDPIVGGISYAYINFTATDYDGVNDLNDTTANVTLKNGTTVKIGTCSVNDINATSTEYRCNVTMYYYDTPGIWLLNASVADLKGVTAYNDTEYITYNQLYSLDVVKDPIEFGTVLPNTNNANATNNPQIVNNTGNMNFTSLNITGYSLKRVGGTELIGAGNFTINVTASASYTGQQIVNGSIFAIAGATLPVLSIEEIYTYVDVPDTLPVGDYNSTSMWRIDGIS